MPMAACLQSGPRGAVQAPCLCEVQPGGGGRHGRLGKPATVTMCAELGQLVRWIVRKLDSCRTSSKEGVAAVHICPPALLKMSVSQRRGAIP